MHQLPLIGQSDTRKQVEDVYDFLRTLVRGWRLIAVFVAITLTLAVIYLAKAKPVYRASAKLLILQQGGQPLNMANGGSNRDSVLEVADGNSNSLATHIMIIRSPLIVGPAKDAAGLRDVSTESVVEGLTVKLPDPTAKVLELSYKAGSGDAAVGLIDAVIKSYEQFLHDHYQENSSQVLELITKARDALNEEVKTKEREYAEFSEKSTAGYALRLMSSVKDVRGIPTEGKNGIIVAAVDHVLHFRIFDGDGKMVVDTDEKRLTEQARKIDEKRLTEQTRQIEDLRDQLESFWHRGALTWSENDRVITAVTSIVGHTRTTHLADVERQTLIARRLEDWNQAISQAKLRSIQLKSQLDLGRKLLEEGEGVDFINSALGHLNATSVNPPPPSADPGAGASVALSSDRLDAQLGDIENQRQTAESILQHLGAEYAKAGEAALGRVSQEEVAREFLLIPEVAACYADLVQTRKMYDNVKAVSRRTDDGAVVTLKKKLDVLDDERKRLWQRYQPVIQDRLAGGDGGQAIRKAQADVIELRAREAAFRGRLEQFKANRLLTLEAERDRLVQLHGPGHKNVKAVKEQIARLNGELEAGPADPRQAQAAALLKSIKHGLESVEEMRKALEQEYRHDIEDSNKSKNAMLAESQLSNDLDRRRQLYNSVVDQLKQAQLVSNFGSVTSQLLAPPTASRVGAAIAMVLLAALVVGCCLGAAAVYVVDQLDARIRSLSEIRRLLDYRMLGVVPLLSRSLEGDVPAGLISCLKPRSRLAETYKSIRTGIDLVRRNWEGKVFMVTSPQPADGKSTTASNLAISMAQSGRKVLLIDADLRRPTQHTIHGHPRDTGLTQVLTDQMPFHEVLQGTEVAGLELLAAGPEVPHPAELLATGRLGSLVGELRQAYDVVIIDTSPLLAVTDASVVAVVVDGIVLVVRASATRRFDAERSQELLRALETPVLGLIVNGIDSGQKGYGHYGYGTYGTYGGEGSSGHDKDVAQGRLSERAKGRLELPGVRNGRTNGHIPQVDS
jgi:capsular exopolysaccharide synthesis family protein